MTDQDKFEINPGGLTSGLVLNTCGCEKLEDIINILSTGVY